MVGRLTLFKETGTMATTEGDMFTLMDEQRKMMKELIIQNAGSDPGDTAEFEELIRLSPNGADYSHNPYRCPVSTPAGYDRGEDREMNGSFISFTSLNRSYQIPRHLSIQKQLIHGAMKKNRPPTNPQQKNFDCYFTDKFNKAPVQRGATWLTSLCSQPVDEIFNKYKRRSEAKFLTQRYGTKCRNVSTPGEKALVHAWSSNTSTRDNHSVVSRSTNSENSRKVRRSNTINTTLRMYDPETELDQPLNSTGFALMPVSSPTIPEADNATWSTTGSVRNQKSNRNNNYCGSLVSENSNINSLYEPYKREIKTFPVIKRKKSLSPAKKKLNSAPNKLSTSLPCGIDQLVESPMEIISVGTFLTSPEPQKSVQSTKPFCSYRLPKNPPSNLPEVKGKG